jgi:hypothetical protein
MKAVKKSMWFLWGFVPYLNFAAWIHAGAAPIWRTQVKKT